MEFKKNPNNDVLREKLIAAALSMNPPPRIPDEAAEMKGWADASYKDAKEPADYLKSIQAYEKAVDAAPWVAESYYGLAAAQEKMGLYAEAIKNFKRYLLASPGAKDAVEVRERIGAIRFQSEKSAENRESARRTADTLGRLKKLAFGKYESTYECGSLSLEQSLRKREPLVCDWKEYSSEFWRKVEANSTHEFRFTSEGTVQLWRHSAIWESLEILGRPNSAEGQSIEWFLCDSAHDCSRPIWVELNQDLSAITVSPDRPVRLSSPDEKKRFHYIRYVRTGL